MSRCDYYFHVVWATKYREPLLFGERELAVYRLLISLGQELGVDIVAVNGMPDHVHFLMKTGAVVNTPDLLEKLKGATSAMLNGDPEFQGRFRWQEGYYSVTVTPSHVPKMEEYIRQQKEHHAAGTTREAWERTEDPDDVPKNRPVRPPAP